MMTAQGIFAHKSRQINAIQHQLVAEFHPSVKNVASAGQNLLKAYQNLSRHHYVYTASLYALAFSASTSEPETREKGVQLERITEALKAIQGEQTKWMEYFTKMTTIIARNCEDEKERLKTLQIGFGKREKDLSKAIERGKKNPMELDKFYERELAEMRDQQTQRYRFFVEKHLELFQKYLEWTHFSALILEKELDGNKNGQTNSNSVPIPIEKRKEEASPPPPPPVEQNRRGSSQIQVQLEGRRLSLISASESSTMMAPNSEIQRQKSANFQPFGHQQGLFRPIPILPQNQQKFRHSLALTDAVGRVNGELSAWERQQMASLPAEHQQKTNQQQMMQPVIQQLQQFYRERPPSNGGLDRIGLNNVENEENNGKLARQSSNVPDHQQFQQNGPRVAIGPQFRHQFISPQKPISPLVTGQNSNISTHFYGNNNFIIHGRGHSQESTASSGFGAARATPPIFSARDYGRLVECTTPYEAQSENQLSLGIGQRIMLVKNGTRGWVLARSEHGERQGWFPAKYLKLVCDE